MFRRKYFGKIIVLFYQVIYCSKGFKLVVSYLNYTYNMRLTVFFRRDIGDMFKPAMIAIRELKLPMLKHSRAVSIQYSITRTRCFFFGCWKPRSDNSFSFFFSIASLVSIFVWILINNWTWTCSTYLAYFSRDEIAQSVEPLDVRFEIARFLHVLKRCFQMRGFLFVEQIHIKSIHKFGIKFLIEILLIPISKLN